MAVTAFAVYENGTLKAKSSANLVPEFSSVKIGTSKLEVKETTGAFDFSAVKLTNIGAATANGNAVEYAQYILALGGKSDTSHNHDLAYLGITATAADSAKLNGQSASYYAIATHNHDSAYAPLVHNHDLAYLGITATAADSSKLNGQSASYYAVATHNHDSTYLALAGGTMTGNIAMGTNKITSSYAPINGVDLVNKTYVDQIAAGLDIQHDVKNVQLDATLDPGASPTTGIRYILTDVGALHANFGTIAGVGNNDIVEYSGSAFVVSFDASTHTTGGILTWVTDLSTWYNYTNTTWAPFGGLSGVNAGVGLDKLGDTIFVKMGAGIAELPTGEVGVDLYATNPGLMLSIDGTTASTHKDAKLMTVVDGTTIERGASGLQVKSGVYAAASHNHDLTYLGITATAADSSKLNGQSASYYAVATHDHDLVYLGITATAADSSKLNGQSASYYSVSTHNHDLTYLGITATAADSSKLNGQSASYYSVAGHGHVAADISDFATAAKTAAVVNSLAGSQTDQAPSVSAVKAGLDLKVNISDRYLSLVNDNASSITINQVVYVKANGAVDLAKNTISGLDAFPLGLVYAASIATTVAGNIRVKAGEIVGGFSGMTPGAKQFVSDTTFGAITEVAPSTGHIYLVGHAISATEMRFEPRYLIEIV